MNINALLMDEADNVVTCVADVGAGEEVCYRNGDDVLSLAAAQDIPFCHKIALTGLAEGDSVIKYGESIGVTTQAVPKGCLVSHENIVSVPRDYESEFAAAGPEAAGKEEM